MKNLRKSVISAGAFALSMAIASMSANVPVAAKGKSGVIKPRDEAAPSTEKGIRDNAVKGCSGCGMTGREAAPPPVDAGAAPGTAPQDLRGGSIVIGATPVDPQSADKAGRPKVRDDSPSDPSATQRGVKSIPGIKHSKTSSLLKIGGGLAALSAVIALAASGGDDNPASP